MGSRRAGRERALSLLYEAEAKGLSVDDLLAELPVAPDPFALDLVRGVGTGRERIDAAIAGHAINWEIDRMPAVDRALLRLAVYELMERGDVPVGVVISEAVELAKQYSTEESGSFVNGVLAAVAAEERPLETEVAGRPLD
ncbi:MAG: transcription antitermination factor NusB [Acidimicrobiales bacterium]|nr:MAG: transcription antitermination factor NusB [Acidimicrobiales bacterium]